jgi:quercetin dioxygenase-like cupin family protein
MLTSWALRCSLLLVIVGVAAGQVQMAEEPHHHLAFRNEALSIFQPKIAPGETTLEHLHSHDEVTVCISGSNMRSRPHDGDWGKPGQPCAPGQVSVSEYAGKQSSHTVQNAGSGVFQLVVVDSLRDQGWPENRLLSAETPKPTRETRAFEIFDLRLDKNASTGTHVHSGPSVLVLVSGEASAGKRRLRRPGEWVLLPAGKPHNVSIRNDTRLIEIEVR